jgi:hypothetical protein
MMRIDRARLCGGRSRYARDDNGCEGNDAW